MPRPGIQWRSSTRRSPRRGCWRCGGETFREGVALFAEQMVGVVADFDVGDVGHEPFEIGAAVAQTPARKILDGHRRVVALLHQRNESQQHFAEVFESPWTLLVGDPGFAAGVHHHYTELAEARRAVENLDPVFERRFTPFGTVVREVVRALRVKGSVYRPQFQSGAFHCVVEPLDPGVVLLLGAAGQISRPGFDPADAVFVVRLLVGFGRHRADGTVDCADFVQPLLAGCEEGQEQEQGEEFECVFMDAGYFAGCTKSCFAG